MKGDGPFLDPDCSCSVLIKLVETLFVLSRVKKIFIRLVKRSTPVHSTPYCFDLQLTSLKEFLRFDFVFETQYFPFF